MANLYRSAILGLGKIAYAHMHGYLSPENISQITVIAGADPNEEARQKFAQEFGLKNLYADYHELLDKEKPDIVSICTWPPLHLEMVEASASAGVKGIVCEKPISVTLGEADRMLEAIKKSNSVLIVGHQRRLHPRYTKAWEMIKDGIIGRLVQVTAICGGDLLTDGTHSVDLIRFMNDDIPAEWVIGNIDMRNRGNVDASSNSFGFQDWNLSHTRYGHPVETGAFAMIHFSNGVRGALETGICARQGYQRMWIYGSEGLIEISGDHKVGDEPPLRVVSRKINNCIVPELPNVNPIAREISLLVESIKTGKIHPLDGSSARATQEILMAIFESARIRGRIDLPVTTKEHPIMMMLNKFQ